MVLVLQYWQQLDRVSCYDLKYAGSERPAVREFYFRLRELFSWIMGFYLSPGLQRRMVWVTDSRYCLTALTLMIMYISFFFGWRGS